MKQKKLLLALSILVCLGIVVILILELNPLNILNTTASNKEPVKPLTIQVKPVKYTYKNIEEIYSLEAQKVTAKKLKVLKEKNKYTISKPLVALNPFGTNTTSLYVYFKHSKNSYLEYTISAEDETMPDFTRTASNDNKNNLTKTHEYQLLGLIPGQQNTVTLRLYNEKKVLLGETNFSITLPELKTGVQTQLDYVQGDSKEELVDGLYFIFGIDAKYTKGPAHILLYDNDGVLRGEIPLKSYRSDRIEMINGNMLYGHGYSSMCMVNSLGQVIRTYKLGDYKQHHDFVYDGKNQALILASDIKDPTREDIIISLNLSSGKVTELIDFKDIMPDTYKKATVREGRKLIDWIHFNTLQLVNGTDLILSSRELSTIIKIDDIYNKPTLDYFIADPFIWKNTKYSKLLLDKIGNFPSQTGQHTVTYVEDSTLPDGQYYLHLYNNNFGSSPTRKDLKWSKIPKIGFPGKWAESSMYYRYLIDEKKGTYKLISRVDVPYSSIVSSTQEIENNIITSSGWSKCYNEYDKDGILIKEFGFDIDSYTYRVFKYTQNGFWFEK